MASRNSWMLIFLVFWIAATIVLYSRSQNGASQDSLSEMQESLDSAMRSVRSLEKKNQQLSNTVESLKSSKLEGLNTRLDSVNKDINNMREQLENAEESKTSCLEELSKLQDQVKQMEIQQQSLLNAQGGNLEQAGKHGVIETTGMGPSLEHEKARFKLNNNIKELWYFTEDQLNKLSEKTPQIKPVLEDIKTRHRSIAVDLISLSQADSADSWREDEHQKLQTLMQNRLHHLQNPENCNTAKKLVCNVNKGCGFGCQLHHAVYCFMVAYGTERTMILESKGWKYSSDGWETVFKPVSDTCTELSPGTRAQQWTGEHMNSDVISMPIIDAMTNRPPYLPLSYPEDLAARLERLTDDPSVWFVGQFVKYLMRYQPELHKQLNKIEQTTGFSNPVVGIHVRRTDKVGTEAAYHALSEYMKHVDDWYNIQERISGKIDKRRVYIASDDPSVIREARKQYHYYEVYGDVSVAQSAGMSSRYTDASLRGVITDIHMLSKCDYLVCTFSSQVCRVGYEIMQTLRPDSSRWFQSLDDIYYFGGQHAHEETVIYKHQKQNKDEIDLEVGDTIGIAGNHWNGYSKGQNRRTGAIGLYPSYKTVDKKRVIKFPSYSHVDEL